jgi:cellulase/cellobiase CelA1
VWQFASDGTLRTLNGSVCLDANARGTANGTPLIVYGCNGGANQQFARGSNGSVVGAQSGRCVDVPNGSNAAEGTSVQLYDCTGGEAQRWTLQTGDNPPTTTTTATTQPQQTATTQPQQTATTATTATTQPQQTATQGSGSCTAVFAVTGQWQGGFQGEVKVTAGSAPVSGWTVKLTFGNGQVISQSWGAKVSQSGSTATATPEAWNGALGAGAGTSFGFIASSNGTNGTPSVTCSGSGR